MDEKLIEQAREFCETNKAWIEKEYRLFAADQIADFATKIRDEAVAAERKRIAEMVREIVSERNNDVLAKAELMADELEQPSPDTPVVGEGE